jgi:hypothetical protein
MVISFLVSLSGGMLAALSCCRLELIAWKFVRLVGIVAFLLTGSAAFLQMRAPRGADGGLWSGAIGLMLVAGGLAFALMVIAPLVKHRARLSQGVCAVGGLAGIGSGCLWTAVAEGGALADWSGRGAAILGGQVCGALLLGTVTVAWMLGHAYLTATGMTIAPLRRLSRLLMAAVVLRIAYVAACLVGLYFLTDGAAELSQVWAVSWPAVTLRLGAGLVLLAIFAYMVLDCVRLLFRIAPGLRRRAEQPASGLDLGLAVVK